MNILIAKAYHIKSSEALCLPGGTTLIIIKAEEAKRKEVCKRQSAKIEKIDREVSLEIGCKLLNSSTTHKRTDAKNKLLRSTQMLARARKGWEP